MWIISDEELISKIYKGPVQLDNTTTNSPLEKQVKDLNRQLPNDDTQVTSKHIRMCSVTTTMTYHFMGMKTF